MQFLEDNLVLMTDSYKLTHWKQLPPGTTRMQSYLESRGGLFRDSVFFGLQYFIKRYLEGMRVTDIDIKQAKDFCLYHFGTDEHFNEEGWKHILNEHKGRLPIRIKAVPEGTVMPVKNALVIVENTDEKCAWLTNYIETLLVQLWYPITVATQSWNMKRAIRWYLEETGDPAGIDYKLHDFGFRGVTCPEQAALGGAAHLVNFKGTDTIAGIVLAANYYKAGVCGHSIPASEHSTITSWGKEHEVAAMRNMLNQYPTGLVACVSDSFDIFKACSDIWGNKLRSQVMARDGVLVIRPDSGEPTEILPQLMELLGNAFGYSVNEKGYKVLHPKVRLIQGDGVDYDSMPKMMQAIRVKGWSIDNIAFGSGGGLLQKLNRDTMKFAFKCSHVRVNGEDREVYKSPITDVVKTSKRGRLKLIKVGDQFQTIKEHESEALDQMNVVFENGKLLREYTFEEIRQRVEETGRYAYQYLG